MFHYIKPGLFVSMLVRPEGRMLRGDQETRLRWAHLDLNQGPSGYEPDALTN